MTYRARSLFLRAFDRNGAVGGNLFMRTSFQQLALGIIRRGLMAGPCELGPAAKILEARRTFNGSVFIHILYSPPSP
jgi:hypothetical protein